MRSEKEQEMQVAYGLRVFILLGENAQEFSIENSGVASSHLVSTCSLWLCHYIGKRKEKKTCEVIVVIHMR